MKRVLVVLVVAGLLTGCQTLDEVRSAGQNKCGQWVGLLGNKNSCYSESELQTQRALVKLREIEDQLDQLENDQRRDRAQYRSGSSLQTPIELCTNGRVMTAYGCRYR